MTVRRGVLRRRASLGLVCLAFAATGAITIAPAPLAQALGCAELLNIGHRGYGAGRDENTVPHMRRAVSRGAHVVEFDVRRTRDGVLAIMHDRTVNRTTNGSGRVSRMTWRKLRSLRTHSGYHPPSLGQLVEAMSGQGVGLQVHLKVGLTASRLRSVSGLLQRHGFSAGTVQFNSESLALLRRVNQVTGFPTGYTYLGRPTRDRLTRVASYGVDVAVLDRDDIKPSWVDYAAARGVELSARSYSISSDWALQNGVRRLVVDRWGWTCATDPDPEAVDIPE